MRVPALREHADDISILADALLHRLAKRNGRPPILLSSAAREALCSYSFPGNVRELENILERAIALSTSGAIEQSDLQLRQLAKTAFAAHDPVSAEVTGANTANPIQKNTSIALHQMPRVREINAGESPALGDQLENFERDAIARALGQTRYNKTAAAKLLGMSFRALRYKVKKLGIE